MQPTGIGRDLHAHKLSLVLDSGLYNLILYNPITLYPRPGP